MARWTYMRTAPGNANLLNSTVGMALAGLAFAAEDMRKLQVVAFVSFGVNIIFIGTAARFNTKR